MPHPRGDWRLRARLTGSKISLRYNSDEGRLVRTDGVSQTPDFERRDHDVGWGGHDMNQSQRKECAPYICGQQQLNQDASRVPPPARSACFFFSSASSSSLALAMLPTASRGRISASSTIVLQYSVRESVRIAEEKSDPLVEDRRPLQLHERQRKRSHLAPIGKKQIVAL